MHCIEPLLLWFIVKVTKAKKIFFTFSNRAFIYCLISEVYRNFDVSQPVDGFKVTRVKVFEAHTIFFYSFPHTAFIYWLIFKIFGMYTLCMNLYLSLESRSCVTQVSEAVPSCYKLLDRIFLTNSVINMLQVLFPNSFLLIYVLGIWQVFFY